MQKPNSRITEIDYNDSRKKLHEVVSATVAVKKSQSNLEKKVEFPHLQRLLFSSRTGPFIFISVAS